MEHLLRKTTGNEWSYLKTEAMRAKTIGYAVGAKLPNTFGAYAGHGLGT